MKISKAKLWESIFKVSPWLVNGGLSLPEALYKTCVDIVLYAEDDENRTNFDYAMSVFYIRSAIIELKKEGAISFPLLEQN